MLHLANENQNKSELSAAVSLCSCAGCVHVNATVDQMYTEHIDGPWMVGQ